MKTNQSLLQVIAVAVLASCASANKKVPVSLQAGPQPSQAGSSQTEELYKAVNAYRASKGVSELQRHAGLERLAREHCEYLRKHRGTFSVYGKNVSHMGDAGRSLIAIRRFGMMNSCENVAWMEPFGPEAKNAKGLVYMWSQSPDHDWAMGSEGWTHTGIGTVVDDDGSVFATQLFCTKDSSQSSLRDLLNGY